MNKRNFTTVQLSQGEMHIYDLGGVRLHAYQTGDPLADEVFLLEKAGQFVVLESPCFADSIAALDEYLKGKTVAGMLVAYHGAGASFLREVPKYATANAVEYAEKGGGRALIDQFAAAFGSAFDSGIHAVDHVIGEGPVTIGGIEFIIHRTAEAFDVEIPEINAVYTHMLGHDCHSIVAGAGHADGMIAQLKAYIKGGVRSDPHLPLHAGGFEGRPDEDRLSGAAEGHRRSLPGRRGLQGGGEEGVSRLRR